MCGLVGIAGNMYLGDTKTFTNLLYLDWFRGKHSTGVGLIKKKDEHSLLKEVGHPFTLYENNPDVFEYQGGIKSTVNLKALIGHNRAATRGAVTKENAHPFAHGDIVGAHNGTLRVTNKLDHFEEFEVDSEALIWNIAEHGPDILNQVSGAWALTWYNQAEEKMYFIRNHERPLYYARSKDRDVVLWASEPWMLKIASSKNSHSIEDEIKEFTANKLYSLDLSDCNFQFRKVEMVEEREILPFVPPSPPTVTRTTGVTVVGGSTGTNPFHGSKASQGISSWLPTKDKKVEMNKLVGKEVTFFFDEIKEGINGLAYLSCSSILDEFEMRIYAEGRPIWTELSTNCLPFTARVKRLVNHTVNGKTFSYFIPDMRSITVKDNILPFDPTSSTNLFKGWKGDITEEEWISNTRQGCAYCDIYVEEKDAPHLHWFGETDFLCPICASDPERLMYANFSR